MCNEWDYFIDIAESCTPFLAILTKNQPETRLSINFKISKSISETKTTSMEAKSTIVKDTVYVVVACAIIILNIIEIVLISRRSNKKTFDKLLLSLGIADLVAGAAVAFFKLTDLIIGSKSKWLDEEKFANIYIFSSSFSAFNLFLIAIDRYFAVKFPIKHRILVTGRRCNIAILCVWLLALFLLCAHMIISILLVERDGYFLFMSSLTILAVGIFLFVIYFEILRSVCKNRLQTSRVEDQDGRTRWQTLGLFFRGPSRAEKAVFLSSCLVAVSFILSTYPFAIEYLIRRSGDDISFISKLMIVVNSLLNPFVYFFKTYFGSRRARTAAEAVEMN